MTADRYDLSGLFEGVGEPCHDPVEGLVGGRPNLPGLVEGVFAKLGLLEGVRELRLDKVCGLVTGRPVLHGFCAAKGVFAKRACFFEEVGVLFCWGVAFTTFFLVRACVFEVCLVTGCFVVCDLVCVWVCV